MFRVHVRYLVRNIYWVTFIAIFFIGHGAAHWSRKIIHVILYNSITMLTSGNYNER